MGHAAPEDTIATRAFSGRLGRSLRTTYADAASGAAAPAPAPYPIQRNLTGPMRAEASWVGPPGAGTISIVLRDTGNRDRVTTTVLARTQQAPGVG